MWFFKKKTKVTSDNIADVLFTYADIIFSDAKSGLSEILRRDSYSEIKLDSYELNRREYELYYFIIAIIIMRIQREIKKKVNYKIILDDFIIKIMSVYDRMFADKNILKLSDKKHFAIIIWSRYEDYERCFVDEPPGPTWHLSKRFLTRIHISEDY